MCDRVLRLPEVLKLTGLSRSTLYQFITRGDFPRQVQLGERSVGWFESHVSKWIQARKPVKNQTAR